MNGVVTLDTVYLVGGILTAAATFGGFLFRGYLKARNELKDEVEPLKLKVEQLGKELEAQKLYAANTYVTKQGLHQTMDEFRSSIDRLADRIDRLLDK